MTGENADAPPGTAPKGTALVACVGDCGALTFDIPYPQEERCLINRYSLLLFYSL